MVEHSLSFELYYDGAWHSADLRQADGTKITWGTRAASEETNPATAEGKIDNLSRWYSPRAVTSPLFGKIGVNTPARFTVDGGDPYQLAMAMWDPQRSADDQDAWTDIQAAGTLQRIGSGINNISTALDAQIKVNNPTAWWPLSDAAGSTYGASAVDGGRDLEVNGATPITFGVVDGPALSVGGKFPELIQDGEYGPVMAAAIPAPAATPSQWQLSFWFKCYSDPALGTVGEQGYPMDIRISGSDQNVIGQFYLQGEGRVTFFTTRADGSGYNILSNPAFFPITDGLWHYTRITFEQVTGSTFTCKIYIDGEFYNQNTGYSGLIGFPSEVRIPGAKTFDYTVPDTLSVMGVEVSTTLVDHYLAGWGHPGETAADRFVRRCEENGITPTVVGDPDESVVMGPQVPRTPLDDFNEIVRTDDAHIFETRGESDGLTMVCGNAKLNASPVLTLSYIGDIMPPLHAVIGDKGLRNDVTAEGVDGTTRRVVQETGPRNVQTPFADPQGVGRYDTRIDVNPADAAGILNAAGWRVGIGTFDGTWYATVTVDLDAAESLIPAVDALAPGDIIGLSDLPTDEALETVNLVVLGFEDTVWAFRRIRTIYCVPADPYRVGILAETSGDTDPLVGHLEGEEWTTVGDVSAGAALIPLQEPLGQEWTADPDDYPMDVVVGGQRVSISGCGPSKSFDGTVSSGWGNAIGGAAVATSGGAASDYNEGSGVGTQSNTSVNVRRTCTIEYGSTDQDLYADVMVTEATATGASISMWVAGRVETVNDCYIARMDVTTTGSVTITINKLVAGVGTNIGATVTVASTHVAGQWWRVRLQVIGSSIKTKAWVPSAEPEPLDWHVTTTDTSLTLGTKISLQSRLTTGNTNTLPVVVSWDNLHPILYPVLVVNTSGHTIQYAIPDGSRVSPYQPLIPTQ